MAKVFYKDKVIAEFIERADAESFVEWKREKLLNDMNEKLLDKIAAENCLDRRYPGTFPLSVSQPYYEAARAQIEMDCRIGEEIQIKKWINTEQTVKEHEAYINGLKENAKKDTVVVNAFGGAGAGKTTACLGIVEELKKRGYVAEYVQEYAKDLVWEENWEQLDGTEKHQYEILREQMHRMDRLYGKVDFIVTDAPILLNRVYNNELTPEYKDMLYRLHRQYDNFNFVVERNEHSFEKEGRMQDLAGSIQKDNEIKEMLKEYGLYFGIYDHKRIPLVINNSITTLKRIHMEHSASYVSDEAIAKELKIYGYEPTKKLTENIKKISEMLGQRISLKNVSFYCQHIDEILDPEVKEPLAQISEECQRQEIENMMMPVMDV